MTAARTLDSFGDSAVWLESAFVADRYQTGTDDFGDSESAWFCRNCSAEVSDPDDGCEHCGYGTAITPSAFDDDAEEDHRTC